MELEGHNWLVERDRMWKRLGTDNPYISDQPWCKMGIQIILLKVLFAKKHNLQNRLSKLVLKLVQMKSSLVSSILVTSTLQSSQ